MSTFSTLAASLAEWQGRAGRLFTQTQVLICIMEFFVCVMCLTAQGRFGYYIHYGVSLIISVLQV
jgi:hypothetical protein